MKDNKMTNTPCQDSFLEVSLECGETYLENDIAAQTTVAKLRETTTRNGCSVTMVFREEANPHIRKSVAEMLLRSMEKRSEAT